MDLEAEEENAQMSEMKQREWKKYISQLRSPAKVTRRKHHRETERTEYYGIGNPANSEIVVTGF